MHGVSQLTRPPMKAAIDRVVFHSRAFQALNPTVSNEGYDSISVNHEEKREKRSDINRWCEVGARCGIVACTSAKGVVRKGETDRVPRYF